MQRFAKIEKKERSSNLELYRIICMLMIVMFHYVVNSGLNGVDGPLQTNGAAPNSIYLWIFGMWGKVGINCFLMITGFFMCKSQITIKKFIKLLLQIYFYKVLIFGVFLIVGYESISLGSCVRIIMPIEFINNNRFATCFLLFYLTIPFWNILIQNINKQQHLFLLLLLLFCYTLWGGIPGHSIPFNYISWFGVLFLISSYFRLYPCNLFENKWVWGGVTIVTMLLAAMGAIISQLLYGNYLLFVTDSNKIFAVLVAVSSFLWFKNINIPQSKIINAIGGSTFGVLLIHANSDAMRTWLWRDTIDCVGHYDLPLGRLILYSTSVVLLIFTVCNLLDQIRIRLIEKPFFKWYDKYLNVKLQSYLGLIFDTSK